MSFRPFLLLDGNNQFQGTGSPIEIAQWDAGFWTTPPPNGAGLTLPIRIAGVYMHVVQFGEGAGNDTWIYSDTCQNYDANGTFQAASIAQIGHLDPHNPTNTNLTINQSAWFGKVDKMFGDDDILINQWLRAFIQPQVGNWALVYLQLYLRIAD